MTVGWITQADRSGWQQRAAAARKAGIFAQEIAAVNVPGTKETKEMLPGSMTAPVRFFSLRKKQPPDLD